MSFSIVDKRRWFYLLSGLFIITGLVLLFLYPPKLSIDFQGGSLLELKVANAEQLDTETVLTTLQDMGYPDAIVQISGEGHLIIRSKSKDFEQRKAAQDEQRENLVARATEEAAAGAETPTATTTAPASENTQMPEETATATVTATPTVSTGDTPNSENEDKETEATGASDENSDENSEQDTQAALTSVDNPAALTDDEQQAIIAKITELYGDTTKVQLQSIGPTIGAELTQKTIWAVIIAMLFITLYIAYSFRSVPAPATPWRFGISTMIALAHDVIFVLGATALLGHLIGLEIDALYVVALLNVISFSVHDSIVSLDRTRENLTKMAGRPFATIVNSSILQTLIRSLNINLAVLFTLFALLLFGPESIKNFLIILIIGIIVGTYSSVFNASPLLVTWDEWEKKKKEQEENNNR